MESPGESDDHEGEETLLLSLLYRRSWRRRSRSVWVRAIFAKCQQQRDYGNLLQEIRLSDPQSHFQYMRMSKEKFDLLSPVGPLLIKCHYFSRQSRDNTRGVIRCHPVLSCDWKLAGVSFFQFPLRTVNDIYGIVRETSQAIWDALKTLYVRAPSNQQEWMGISDQF